MKISRVDSGEGGERAAMKVAIRMSALARTLKTPRIVCGAAWNNNNPIQAGGIWQWGRKQWNNQPSAPLTGDGGWEGEEKGASGGEER